MTKKQVNMRPDPSIDIIHGASLSDRIGCGKVKAQYQVLSHRLVGIELVRVATSPRSAAKGRLFLPISLDQVPLFISRLNKVIKVISCFQSVVNGDTHDYAQNSVTLTDHTMHQVADAKISNQRKTIFSHYSH